MDKPKRKNGQTRSFADKFQELSGCLNSLSFIILVCGACTILPSFLGGIGGLFIGIGAVINYLIIEPISLSNAPYGWKAIYEDSCANQERYLDEHQENSLNERYFIFWTNGHGSDEPSAIVICDQQERRATDELYANAQPQLNPAANLLAIAQNHGLLFVDMETGERLNYVDISDEEWLMALTWNATGSQLALLIKPDYYGYDKSGRLALFDMATQSIIASESFQDRDVIGVRFDENNQPVLIDRD